MTMAAPVYFTFNTDLQEYAETENYLKNLKYDGEIADTPHALQYTWQVWEQVVSGGKARSATPYSDATKPIHKFDTVEEFWNLWNSLPQPSKLVKGQRMVRRVSDADEQAVDAIMIFKDGIKPEWEDPKNEGGGHFEIKLKPSGVDAALMDEYWNNLVLALVGGTFDHMDLITGVRLVDKLKDIQTGGRQDMRQKNDKDGGGAIRLEIWYTSIPDGETLNALKQSVEKTIFTRLNGQVAHSTHLSIDTKSHQKSSYGK
eukprot:Selendium_serpulae@DN5232_c0_g1_i1.p1